jgi:hypothetical protein
MARGHDHPPLWTPLLLLALSMAAGGAWTLSMRHGPVTRAAADVRPAAAPHRPPS